MFPNWLEAWKVDECHYNIKGEEFYIKDDDVQIINKLINGIDESNVPKYEQKKCVYDISGNECLITNLSSYIVFLLCDKPNFDDKVAAEIKEIYLKDKIDRNKKEFAKKTHCFIGTLPKPIFIAIRKAEKEYNEDSILQLTKNLKSNTDSCFQHITPENFVNTLKQMMSYYDGFLELIFEETSEGEIQLLRQKLESEITEEIYYFIGEKIKNQRLKVKNDISWNDICDVINNDQYEPISEFDLYFIQAVVIVYHEEYEEWKSKAEIEGTINLDFVSEFYFKEGYRNEAFLFYYIFFEGKCFSQLFHAMNYGFIKPEVMKKYVIDRLQELELAEYVQKRYDEYRKVTGGGKDFCFYERLDIIKVGKELSRYYANLPNGEKNYFFTRMCLSDVIDNVIPALKSGLDVAAFASLLWKSKFFNSSIEDDRFSNFRDDIANIFKLNGIPNITDYTVGKLKVKEKAKKLRGQFKSLEILVEEKYFT